MRKFVLPEIVLRKRDLIQRFRTVKSLCGIGGCSWDFQRVFNLVAAILSLSRTRLCFLFGSLLVIVSFEFCEVGVFLFGRHDEVKEQRRIFGKWC